MKAQQEILQRISAKLNIDKEQREVQDEQRKAKEEKLEMLIRAFRAQERRKKAKEKEDEKKIAEEQAQIDSFLEEEENLQAILESDTKAIFAQASRDHKKVELRLPTSEIVQILLSFIEGRSAKSVRIQIKVIQR